MGTISEGLYSLHSRCTHQIAATFDCLLFAFGSLVDSFLHPPNVCRCPLHYFLLLLLFIVGSTVAIAAGDGGAASALCGCGSIPSKWRTEKECARLEKARATVESIQRRPNAVDHLGESSGRAAGRSGLDLGERDAN